MDLTGKHYTWFQNRECEYFPATKGCGRRSLLPLLLLPPLPAPQLPGQLRAAGRDQGLLLLPAAPQRAGELRLHPSQTDGVPWCLGSGGDPLSQDETLLHAPIERGQNGSRQRPAPPGSRSAYPVPERGQPAWNPRGAQPAACRGRALPPSGGGACAKEPAHRVPRHGKSPEERALLRACVLREPVSMVGV